MEKEKIINKKLACVRDVAGEGKHVYPLAPACTLIDTSMTWGGWAKPGVRMTLAATTDKGISAWLY